MNATLLSARDSKGVVNARHTKVFDAGASMLYRDYSRAPGERVPNVHGRRESRAALSFSRQMNEVIGRHAPGKVTITEKSTTRPAVSRPPSSSGPGLHQTRDMGWMHDTLKFMSRDPIHRKFHHNQLMFSRLYMLDQNFVLPLSQDEAIHRKDSLAGQMPGENSASAFGTPADGARRLTPSRNTAAVRMSAMATGGSRRGRPVHSDGVFDQRRDEAAGGSHDRARLARGASCCTLDCRIR